MQSKRGWVWGITQCGTHLSLAAGVSTISKITRDMDDSSTKALNLVVPFYITIEHACRRYMQ